ncbi:MAG: CU044_2847 family protein [Geitlerinemataceae cyanobacterium]
MNRLTRLQLKNGATVYLETTEVNQTTQPQEQTRDSLGKSSKMLGSFGQTFASAESLNISEVSDDITAAENTVKDTIRNYTEYVVDTLKEVTNTKVKTVTLEFGIEIAGEVGIPYITKGSAKGNLKVSVTCDLSETEPDKPEG